MYSVLVVVWLSVLVQLVAFTNYSEIACHVLSETLALLSQSLYPSVTINVLL